MYSTLYCAFTSELLASFNSTFPPVPGAISVLVASTSVSAVVPSASFKALNKSKLNVLFNGVFVASSLFVNSKAHFATLAVSDVPSNVSVYLA